MSGGDYSTPSRSGSTSYTSNCASLFDKTILNSPNPEVLVQLDKGAILPLVILTQEGRRLLIALGPDGQPAGSITSAALAKIFSCIEDEGFSFVAEVIEINGGACSVYIRPEV